MDYNIDMNPRKICDKNGNVYKSLGFLKNGDEVFCKIDGKLVAGVVVALNPLTISAKAKAPI